MHRIERRSIDSDWDTQDVGFLDTCEELQCSHRAMRSYVHKNTAFRFIEGQLPATQTYKAARRRWAVEYGQCSLVESIHRFAPVVAGVHTSDGRNVFLDKRDIVVVGLFMSMFTDGTLFSDGDDLEVVPVLSDDEIWDYPFSHIPRVDVTSRLVYGIRAVMINYFRGCPQVAYWDDEFRPLAIPERFKDELFVFLHTCALPPVEVAQPPTQQFETEHCPIVGSPMLVVDEPTIVEPSKATADAPAAAFETSDGWFTETDVETCFPAAEGVFCLFDLQFGPDDDLLAESMQSTTTKCVPPTQVIVRAPDVVPLYEDVSSFKDSQIIIDDPRFWWLLEPYT